jgi:preprotein translocase subunit SecA
MRVNQQNTSEYNKKVESLFLDVDYILFQEHATSLINELHDQESQQQWKLFCYHLNNLDEKKSEKLLLMQLAFRCFEQPLTNTQLAQLITLSFQLKEAYGLKLYRDLLEANVSASDRQMTNYITIFQLLIELNEVDDISKLARSNLPNLQNLILFLYSTQAKVMAEKYPKRNIDEVLERFGKIDDSNQYPLKQETLQSFKKDYLAIEAHLDEITSLPQAELKDQFLQHAKQWRDNRLPEAKQHLIAILVQSIRRFYKILPYDTQIIAFLALINEGGEKFRGRIGQVKAGEGKSTIFAMLIAYKASQGYFVDLITSSSYLSIRDYEKYKPFLNALGLTSSHICHQHQQQEHFHAQILYGTNSDFEFALLRDGLNKNKLRYSYRLGENTLQSREADVIFIDEVDNMMLDSTGAARMAIPGADNMAWVYKPIFDFVNEKINNQPGDKNTIDELRKYLKTKTHSKYHTELSKLSDAKLLRWITSAQIAFYRKLKNRDYVVEDNEIRIVDYDKTGRISQGTQWQHGIHQFTQVKEGLLPKPESLTAASIAHPTFFSQYKEIYGLTGTMGELAERDEIQKIYAVENFDVPPHLPCQRIKMPERILLDESRQLEVIFDHINQMQKQGRPTLVLFESIHDSEEMSQFLQSKGIRHQVLNEQQRESEDYIISRAGEPKMITIATNTAGRGTDILLTQESLAAGGLHQIFAFYCDNSRVQEQGECRAGRQGQPGSSCMILQANDPHIFSLLASSQTAILLWRDAKTENEKMVLLNQLRTNKTIKESVSRRYSAKLESLYFNYLNKFFLHLQTLRSNLDTPEFKKQLQDNCTEEFIQTTCPYPVDLKSKHWAPLYRSALTLISNHSLGKQVDWISFVEQYCNTFEEHFVEYWGLFYSKLSDDVDGLDIVVADKIIKESYHKLNLTIHCSPETVIATLKHILFRASSPEIEKEITEKSELSSINFFSKKNPINLYKLAIQYVKEKKYQEALKYCEAAIDAYRTSKGEFSIEMSKCYSLQATCYRDLGLIPESLIACESAINICHSLTIETSVDELSAVVTKYKGCLVKSGFGVTELYPSAVALYKDKNYEAAICKLLHILENITDLNPVKMGTCYSTLASCYREVGKILQAMEACEKAISSFKLSALKAEKKTELINPVLTKLEGLKSNSISFVNKRVG